MKKQTKWEIEKQLNANSFYPDIVSVRKGIVTAKRSYFYRHGYSEVQMAKQVMQAFPDATIIESGDHMHAFVGGCKTGSAQDSYFWVKFSL